MRKSGQLAKFILVTGALAWLVAIGSALPVHAAPRLDPGTVTSSPTSGPAGTVITVSGSNWQIVPDGTAVTFGYSPNADCGGATIVGGPQASTVQGGVFSGGFRWPMGAGTPATIYTICAQLGGIAQPAPSSYTFTLLATAQPHLAVSPATVTAGQHATVTGSNFLPAGTSVALTLKGSGGNVNLGSVPSDGSGNISKTFTVPSTMTGAARVDASAGTGMTASATFTVKAVVPTVTPTPRPTATPAPTATSAATTTPTSGTPTTPTTDQANTGSTPVPTSTSNNGQANTGSGGQPNFLFIGLAFGMIIVLATIIIIVLSLRGRKQGVPAPGAHPQRIAPFQQREASMQSLNYAGVPSYVDTIIHGEPAAPPPQSLNYAGVPSYVDAIIHGEPAMPEPPMAGPSPWAQLRVSNMATTNLPAAPGPGARSLIDELTRPMPASAAPPPIHSILPDPALEAAIRQAQAGLLIVPGGPRRSSVKRPEG